MKKERIIAEAREKAQGYFEMFGEKSFGWRARAGASREKYLYIMEQKEESWFSSQNADSALLAIDKEVEAGYWEEADALFEKRMQSRPDYKA